MLESFTQGARRAYRRAEARARHRGAGAVEPTDLLAALVDEAESRAAVILAESGVESDRLWRALRTAGPPATGDGDGDDLDLDPDGDFRADDGDRLPTSEACRAVVGAALARAREFERGRDVGTEHLLAALAAMPGPAADAMVGLGLDPQDVILKVRGDDYDPGGPLPVPSEIAPLDLGESSRSIDLGRILDASANRAREGLRVVEDYARFALDDPGLTRRLKEVRHRLAEALGGFDPALLLAARDTRGDVGTHIMTPSEGVRANTRAVLVANFKRTAEALRSLEEYAKLIDSWLAGRFEVLRYDVYTLEKLTMTAAASARTFGPARLMVLVGGLPTLGDLTWVVGEALAGGADVIQLREKGLPDREWLSRACEVRILTAQAGARFVVNDRPDLARLAGADGVHLGQDDLSVRDARRVVGPAMTVGVSTHRRSQLDAAVLAAAGYLGVGPVFTSATKDFDDYAGLAFVREAAEATALPWFAIGGIDADNLDDVLEAGACRVAVSGAVVRAERPRAAAAALRQKLDAAD